MALFEESARVLSNQQVGPRLYLMKLASPQVSQSLRPGQFVHMKMNGFGEHILRRPFSVLDACAKEGTIDILYQVVGEGSAYMTKAQPGFEFDVIGSIGHGWTVPSAGERVCIVGGGVGAAPLFTLAKEAVAEGAQVQVVLGAANKDSLVTREKYTQLLGAEPLCATDDGSYGLKGFVVDPVRELLAAEHFDKVYVCGPQILMRLIAEVAAEAGVPCEVSLEKRMACGVGACLSCVCETILGKKRACIDGPVFDAAEVNW